MISQRRIAARLLHAEGSVPDRSVEKVKSLLDALHGEVLEIGPGRGDLLTALPRGISYTALEPNTFLHEALTRTLHSSGRTGRIVGAPAEKMPFADNTFDAVVSIRTLCSMNDLAAALTEVRRVLKPGGKFILSEHVAAPAASWRRVLQQIVRPFWKQFVGCNLATDVEKAVRKAGFTSIHLEPWFLDGSRSIIAGPRLSGFAQK